VEDTAARLPDATLRETFMTSLHVLQIRRRAAATPHAVG